MWKREEDYMGKGATAGVLVLVLLLLSLSLSLIFTKILDKSEGAPYLCCGQQWL